MVLTVDLGGLLATLFLMAEWQLGRPDPVPPGSRPGPPALLPLTPLLMGPGVPPPCARGMKVETPPVSPAIIDGTTVTWSPKRVAWTPLSPQPCPMTSPLIPLGAQMALPELVSSPGLCTRTEEAAWLQFI
ncbi:hypothetical protein CB1_001616063 [Camelus ferus]|nr:hypothetical protein CB1_001616063 [Camelus ferus]